MGTPGYTLGTTWHPLVYAMATAGTGTGPRLAVGLTIPKTRYRIPSRGHPAVYRAFGARLFPNWVPWKWQIGTGTLVNWTLIDTKLTLN